MNTSPEALKYGTALIADLQRQKRQFKHMADNMASMIDWPHQENMERASGQCICSKCLLNYSEHPQENGLTLTCDGRLWQL